MSESEANTVVAPAESKGTFMDTIKSSWKRHKIWWIMGIAIIAAAILGLIIWAIVSSTKRNKAETFVPYDPQSNKHHENLNLQPETSYLESYINTALALGN